MDRELINKSKEILDRDTLDLEEQKILKEISLGKVYSYKENIDESRIYGLHSFTPI